jgi:hypothetical protein
LSRGASSSLRAPRINQEDAGIIRKRGTDFQIHREATAMSVLLGPLRLHPFQIWFLQSRPRLVSFDPAATILPLLFSGLYCLFLFWPHVTRKLPLRSFAQDLLRLGRNMEHPRWISIEEENGENRNPERNGKRRLRLDCGHGESEERREPLPIRVDVEDFPKELLLAVLSPG